MNVYIVADIEGTAGVVFYEHRHNEMSRLNYELLQRNRILMTEEVNAAARGAFDAGADLVLVHDHHGCGYTLLPERLDERVELIHGRNEHTLEMKVRHPDLDGTFDALVLTGMHAKAGTWAGGTPHSLIRVEDGKGKVHELSEATMSIALAGASGVPCVFCAGDRATVNDALDLVPNMAFVITKKHYAPQLARTMSPKRACEMIRASVREGLASVGEIKPFAIPGPCTVQIADRNPEALWPKEPNRCEDFPTALTDAIRNVPWFKPITKIDDGWRWPDRAQPSATPNDEWN